MSRDWLRWLMPLAAALLLVRVSPAAERAPDFLRDVKPILAQRCFRCHSSLEQESNLRLDTAAGILKGGDGGFVIVPGNSSDSRLIAAVQRKGELQMPPEGDPLTENQIAVLRAWIDAGAVAPIDEMRDGAGHWAFQSLTRPVVPNPRDPKWSLNPIDAFIAARHEELNLSPVAEAPPNLLARRVYLDLIGLPPTPEQLQEALSKDYEAVVDRLLASPHYGERWGRHWMDVWRYSDWDGYKQEIRESQPHIWRWRDWIIESLNADKPYDRMVQEMLAADELAPTDQEALRATGYLVRSWYKFNRNKWLDDVVEHTGKAFLGMTFNCCRCHDHMYDPLQQRDYYALRAFFEPHNIRTDRLPGQPDIAKDGLVRVFDAKLDVQTFVFARGNEKEPLKDQPQAPRVPAIFELIPREIESVKLPQIASYPGLAPFVREETLGHAREEVENAKRALAEAEKGFAEALKNAQATSFRSDSQVPSPPQSLFESDTQLALATKRLEAAQASLDFNNARAAADDANYGDPPTAFAKDLSLAAAKAERLFKLRQSEKQLLEAEVGLAAAERAKKPNDMKSAKAVADAQNALTAARKARADAVAEQDQPLKDYTRFTPTYPATSTGRRLALARWITSKENPLAARVAINHIWLRHFGSPLVPTVFDFGINGKPPTNQPLLDWLAVELMESGWRMKHIHKLIVTSRTYRLASSEGFRVQGSARASLNPEPRTPNPSIDPENIYYWRFNPRRMEAEIVRDATLHVAGSLDPTPGGPELDPKQGFAVPRRSVYFRSSKEKKMEFLSLFDSPNPVDCYRRSESVAPQQALAMANSTLTLTQSRLLARRISDALNGLPADESPAQFVTSAFVRILCREPNADEQAACLEFLAEQTDLFANTKGLTTSDASPAVSVLPANDPAQRARENLVHVLLNHNDFVTIR